MGRGNTRAEDYVYTTESSSDVAAKPVNVLSVWVSYDDSVGTILSVLYGGDVCRVSWRISC